MLTNVPELPRVSRSDDHSARRGRLDDHLPVTRFMINSRVEISKSALQLRYDKEVIQGNDGMREVMEKESPPGMKCLYNMGLPTIFSRVIKKNSLTKLLTSLMLLVTIWKDSLSRLKTAKNFCLTSSVVSNTSIKLRKIL